MDSYIKDPMIQNYVVLDNIRSAYNVGSIFRTSDAVGNCMILICGISPTPENPKVLKTSLDSEKNVPWKYFKKSTDAVNTLINHNITVYAIETEKNAINYLEASYPNKCAFIFGHEKSGVSKEVINLAKNTIMIPMSGIKESLNVAVTTGIILFDRSRRNNI